MRKDVPSDPSTTPQSPDQSPLPLVRTGVAGFLMGLANLVPGVSGGTMIVVMGLYDDFITSIADASRLRFSRRNITFLAIVGCAAAVAIGSLAGTMSRLVTLHPSAMFSLFIGMTLGGAPTLARMIHGKPRSCVGGFVVGLALMIAIVCTRSESPDRQAVRDAVAENRYVVEPAYGTDLTAGVLGISAMVLPGISGAYMFLILGRYEAILAAVAMGSGANRFRRTTGPQSIDLEGLFPIEMYLNDRRVDFSNVAERIEPPQIGGRAPAELIVEAKLAGVAVNQQYRFLEFGGKFP